MAPFWKSDEEEEEKKKEKKPRKKEVVSEEEIGPEVVLKDGNREGLLALVNLSEEVNVEQDHDSNIESIGFKGTLNVENPSTQDRLWDIDILLSNIEKTNLESAEIQIRELGITEEDKIDSREFQLTGEVKNLLLVKEYI
ncbi:MAG: hypothetical protein GF383_12090, partial [Candidatus Lokiarchaeota archaeon]|nr:hypothetical protein [Candidatus Lokiarchaeota archaeon]